MLLTHIPEQTMFSSVYFLSWRSDTGHDPGREEDPIRTVNKAEFQHEATGFILPDRRIKANLIPQINTMTKNAPPHLFRGCKGVHIDESLENTSVCKFNFRFSGHFNVRRAYDYDALLCFRI